MVSMRGIQTNGVNICGREVAMSVQLLAQMFPVVTIIPIFKPVRDLDLLNTYTTLVFAQPREMRIISVGMSDFIGQFGVRYGELMASTMMISIPIIAVFLPTALLCSWSHRY